MTLHTLGTVWIIFDIFVYLLNREGSVHVLFVIVFQVVITVEVVGDDTPTTTIADGLIDTGIDIGIDVNTVMFAFEDDPEFEDPTVSGDCDFYKAVCTSK